MSFLEKPLEEGKKLHFNVIYNHARSRYSITPDTVLSLKFVEFLGGKLNGWGYTQFYYYDEHARPGRNVFEELKRVVNESEWTFVILTKEFSSNYWVEYCQQAAFMNLIDKRKRDKLIPIMVGDVELPAELKVNDVLSFDHDPKTWEQGHTFELGRLQRVLSEKISIADSEKVVSCDAELGPIQGVGDGEIRSERNHLITSPQPSGEIKSERNHLITTPQPSGEIKSERIHLITTPQPSGEIKSERIHLITAPQPSIHESLSTNSLDIEMDGPGSFDNPDGPIQHLAADAEPSSHVSSPTREATKLGQTINMQQVNDLQYQEKRVNDHGSMEQGELTKPKHLTSNSDPGYVSEDDISSIEIVRGKESKPEEVTNNKNKDDTPVRVERPEPTGSETDVSVSMIPTSRIGARNIAGYGEVIVKSLLHSYIKTDMLSTWS